MVQDMELRPLSFGELLDRSLRLYRRNFWKFLGISAIVQLPIALLSFFVLSSTVQDFFTLIDNPLAATEVSQNSTLVMQLASNLNTILSTVVAQLANAALVMAVVGALFGRNLTFSDAYRSVFKRWQTLFGTAFLSLVVVILLLVATVVLILSIVGWIAGLGALFFFSLGVSSLIIPVIMLERVNAWDSIPRAWNLARRHFWRVLGFAIILALFVTAFQAGPAALITGLLAALLIDGSMSAVSGADFIPAIVTGVIGASLLSIFIVPLRITAITLFYLDIRVRDEGLDLLVATKPADSDPFDALANAPRNRNKPLFNRQDIGRYFGLGFLFFLIYAALVAAVFGIALAFTSALIGL